MKYSVVLVESQEPAATPTDMRYNLETSMPGQRWLEKRLAELAKT